MSSALEWEHFYVLLSISAYLNRMVYREALSKPFVVQAECLNGVEWLA
jgi:hypothetical protein